MRERMRPACLIHGYPAILSHGLHLGQADGTPGEDLSGNQDQDNSSPEADRSAETEDPSGGSGAGLASILGPCAAIPQPGVHIKQGKCDYA